MADHRPDLVKAIVAVEINGNPFAAQLRWGLTASPITYDPPVTNPSEFVLVDNTPPPDSPRPVVSPYKLQAEPAHKWKNLQHIPIAWVTSEFGGGGSPVANVAFLKQAGCNAEMLRLRDYGIYGNGNLMPLEKNNHEVFGVIRDWLARVGLSDAADHRAVLRASSKRLLPWLVAVAFFMEQLDTTILNTAVPAIAEALKVAPLSMKSVLASYTLSLAVFIPISGWMADRFGTRRVFSSAIGLFTLGSLLCGLCTNIHVLVAFRILQGCGGAMMVPVGRLTLVRAFAKSELVQAMAFVSIPGLIGPMLGPIAGGLIVAYFHLAGHLLRQPSHRPRRPGAGVSSPARFSRARAASARSHRADPVRLRHRAAVLRAGGFRRA